MNPYHRKNDGDSSIWLFSTVSTWQFCWPRTNTNQDIASFRWLCLEYLETEEQIDMLFRTHNDVNEFRPMLNQRRPGLWRWKTQLKHRTLDNARTLFDCQAACPFQTPSRLIPESGTLASERIEMLGLIDIELVSKGVQFHDERDAGKESLQPNPYS